MKSIQWSPEQRIFSLTSFSTKNYSLVLEAIKDRPHDLETFSTYAPENRFIEAHVGDFNLSFSVSDEDGSIFSMALGRDPVILNCDRLSTTRGVVVNADEYQHRANWDFYSIDNDRFRTLDTATLSENDLEISDFLKSHAPNSSVWPGDKEILFWGEKRIDDALVSLGALVKWRTGQVMFASIATHMDHRGKGFAQQLVSEMLATAAMQGITHIGLGVFAENAAAKRAYEKVGFELVNEFSSYNVIKHISN